MKTLQPSAYDWRGIDSQGNKIKGVQDAIHPELLRLELQRRGISNIKASKKRNFCAGLRNINHQDIVIFSRQMAMLLKSGIALAQVLEIMGKGCKKIKMKNLIFGIKYSVEQGNSLTATLKKFPQYFNILYCSLVAVGEHSGALDLMFKQITYHKEKLELLKNKIRKVLFYPVAVVVVALAVTIVLLIFVLPQFESLFHSFGTQLPLPTRVIIQISLFLQRNAGIILTFFILLISSFVLSYKYSQKFVNFFDRVMLRLPLTGGILRKFILARFVQTFAVTYSAGLPLTDGLQIIANAAGNKIYQQAIQRIHAEVINGQTLRYALHQTDLFPDILLQMVAVGEESGTLETMLIKLSDIIEEEINHQIDNLNNLLEPSIMIVLGLIIGGLLVAMYLPIFRLGSVI